MWLAISRFLWLSRKRRELELTLLDLKFGSIIDSAFRSRPFGGQLDFITYRDSEANIVHFGEGEIVFVSLNRLETAG